MLDLVPLCRFPVMNISVDQMIDNVTYIPYKIKKQVEVSAAKYKMSMDKHRLFKSFNKGGILTTHLHRRQFLTREYNKLGQKKAGPLRVCKISDNVYVIDLRDCYAIFKSSMF